MSGKALGWAYEQRTGTAESKSVLVSLADNASEWREEPGVFVAFPGVRTTAKKTELSERCVQQSTRRLYAGLGLVEIVPVFDGRSGRQTSNHYRLVMDENERAAVRGRGRRAHYGDIVADWKAKHESDPEAENPLSFEDWVQDKYPPAEYPAAEYPQEGTHDAPQPPQGVRGAGALDAGGRVHSVRGLNTNLQKEPSTEPAPSRRRPVDGYNTDGSGGQRSKPSKRVNTEGQASDAAQSKKCSWRNDPLATKIIERFGSGVFISWFASCELVADDDTTIRLIAPTQLKADYIIDRYAPPIEALSGKTLQVDVRAAKASQIDPMASTLHKGQALTDEARPAHGGDVSPR